MRELGATVDELRRETVPLVHDARVVVDQAATEMVRVGDVLDSAEAVSSTVDSASRLAYRAFSNPVVKVLAYSTGLGSAAATLLRAPSGRRTPARAATARTGRAELPGPAGARSPRRRGTVPPARGRRRRRRRGGAAVIRRPLWLAAGAALGVGGTVWTVVGSIGCRGACGPTAVATSSPRSSTAPGAARPTGCATPWTPAATEARRREDDLWRDLAGTDRGARR